MIGVIKRSAAIRGSELELVVIDGVAMVPDYDAKTSLRSQRVIFAIYLYDDSVREADSQTTGR